MSEEQFKQAVWLIRNGPKKDSSTEDKLSFYKLYKQVTEGDVTGSQPWAVQIESRAKWDAWNSVKGASWPDLLPTPAGVILLRSLAMVDPRASHTMGGGGTAVWSTALLLP
jgi:diazepam-binding inhibitor (GABA receptor modulating acyl-CoA-binding protein)